jgi:hypothetical protein
VAPKPCPDFSAEDFIHLRPRARLQLIREFICSHAGPIAQADVCRLMAQMCRISMELLAMTRTSSRWSSEQLETARLLQESIDAYDRR